MPYFWLSVSAPNFASSSKSCEMYGPTSSPGNGPRNRRCDVTLPPLSVGPV